MAMTYSIRIDKSVPIEMRDGTLLRGDVYRPDDREKHPALLTRSPYERTGAFEFNSAFMPYYDAVMAGYAVIVQSVRGTYDSGGKNSLNDNSLGVDGPDGYDSLEWVAAQPWCDGNVGTMGGSYMGLVQWITARENPPHLKAIAPWISGSGGEKPSRHNGIVNLGVALAWLLRMSLEQLIREEKMGKDVSSVRGLLEQANASPELVYNYLPLKDVPHFNYPGIREMWTSRILDSSRDTPEYFEKTRTPYERVKVPCLHVSGWYDFYPSGTLGHFNSMRQKGGSEFARKNQYIVMGPWLHPGPTSAGDTGSLGFGLAASKLGS
jgi:putative CocE/NonD family hydrolase